jgi:hypothetical protein
MTHETTRATTGAGAAVPATRARLDSETVADDLPYTKDGLLDIHNLCHTAGRFCPDKRIDRMHQTAYGCSTVVKFLQAEDSILCAMGDNIRGGLLSALVVMLDTLHTDVQWIDDAQRRAERGAA